MYIHNSFKYSVLLSAPSGLEFLLVTLIRNHFKISLGVFYRPPSSSNFIFNTFSDVLLSIHQSYLSNLIICGDFNVNFNPSHYLYSHLLSFMSNFSLSQIVKFSTRQSSTIDLVLVSKPTNIECCTAIPELANSDHLGVSLSVLNCDSRSKKGKNIKRKVWNYSAADFDRANEIIDTIEWEHELNSEDVNASVLAWQTLFLQTMELSIPYTTMEVKRRTPWISRKIITAINKRNVYFRRAKLSQCPSDEEKFRAQFRAQRNHVVAMIRQSKRIFFSRLNTANAKLFWKTVKTLNGTSCSIPTLETNGKSIDQATDKADALNGFFHSCFNRDCLPLRADDFAVQFGSLIPSMCPEELLCTEEEVYQDIAKLVTGKSMGCDGISAKMLKNTAGSNSLPLTSIFNSSISTGCFPSAWKMARVVPIPKGGDPTRISTYRPISILPIISKILEKHVKLLCEKHICDQAPISPRQWGFMTSRSTVSALIQVLYDWSRALDEGHEVCVVFFDVKKAFDTVPHVLLLEHLQTLNLNKYLLSWLKSYLLERKQFVGIEGYNSSSLHALSGVPQGSVLGPLLFIVYINQVTNVISQTSKLNMFADDMALYRVITSVNDYLELQNDINEVYNFLSSKLLKLNLTKCKFMSVSRKTSRSLKAPTLLLDGSLLQQVSEFKYLGITISADLSWRPHIDTICRKTRKLIGLLHRRFAANSSTATLLKLFKSFVRPHLEYASVVWNPYYKTQINNLERVQRFAIKVCLKKWNLRSEELLALTQLPSLQYRRVVAILCHLFKVLRGLTDFPDSPLTHRSINYSCRTVNSLSLVPYKCRTSQFKYSFFPIAVSLWNKIVSCRESDLVDCISVSSFKTYLHNYISIGDILLLVP